MLREYYLATKGLAGWTILTDAKGQPRAMTKDEVEEKATEIASSKGHQSVLILGGLCCKAQVQVTVEERDRGLPAHYADAKFVQRKAKERKEANARGAQ